LAARAVSSNMGLKELRKETADLIKGTPQRAGIVRKHYIDTGVYDLLSVQDNVVNKVYADQLGLNHFVYSGGEMKTTRDFCKARDGKVYTEEEVLSWQSRDWQGKNPNLSIFDAVGGYNCRHVLAPISQELAEALRPELAG